MNVDEYLRRIPKVELHNHVTGAVRLDTVIELSKKNGIPLPTSDPNALYEYSDLIGFLTSHTAVCNTLRDRDDFARVAYECLEDGYTSSNVRYMEIFFNPTNHMAEGVPYATVVDGLVDGIRRARDEFGIRAQLIPSINRQESVAVAQTMLDAMAEYRHDEVIGIGMDHDELPHPPEKFAGIYQAAGDAGFRRTAHTSHDGPGSYITTCLDLLGCDRIDHGYNVLSDAEALKRVVDEQIAFTCAISSVQAFWMVPASDDPGAPLYNRIAGMVESGVNVTLHTDDATMLHTDLSSEYKKFCDEFSQDPSRARDVSLAALDACWLDDSEKAALRSEFETDFASLGAELASS